MSQYYGVLRVVRVRVPANATTNADSYPIGFLPGEGLVHVLTSRETTIGRALNNDIVLLDSTVSREHVRLVLDAHGWHLVNLTTQNIVRVNGRSVPSGGNISVPPQDIVILGLLYILVRGLAHEAAVIREFLAVEVSNGVVLVDEYALLQNSFQRTKEERRVLRKSGVQQWLRLKALYQTEIGLAFRKWHVSMGDKPKLGYVQTEDAYRQRIRRLRDDINKNQSGV